MLSEISDLENGLLREKESHSETKLRLRQLEQEIITEREENRNSKEFKTIPGILADSEGSQSKIGDAADPVAVDQDSAKLIIAKLEDEVKHLEQKLEHVRSESEIQVEVIRARCERQDLELLESRAHCKALRAEILELSQKSDTLSDEKNSYRFGNLFNSAFFFIMRI